MRRKPAAFLYLTGGLGNQLFQYAALQAYIGYESKFVLSNFGNPRKNEDGIPQINSMLGDNIIFLAKKCISVTLAEKLLGLNLRLSVGAHSKLKSFRAIIKFISDVTLSVLFCEKICISFNPEQDGKTVKHSIIVLGYFQKYNYSHLIKSKIVFHSFLKDKELQKYSELAKKVNPLVVHVRRGDYTQEKLFGLLNNDYYSQAIQHCLRSTKSPVGEIWIFSDDIDAAKNMIQSQSEIQIRWISAVNSSPVATLIAMSFGINFVIANSTYSWWGAFLSSSAETVCCPEKWFKDIESDPNLFLPSWHQITNSFE
jgi:hypothetical protein